MTKSGERPLPAVWISALRRALRARRPQPRRWTTLVTGILATLGVTTGLTVAVPLAAGAAAAPTVGFSGTGSSSATTGGVTTWYLKTGSSVNLVVTPASAAVCLDVNLTSGTNSAFPASRTTTPNPSWTIPFTVGSNPLTFSVTVSDKSNNGNTAGGRCIGNKDPIATQTFTLDNTAPAAPTGTRNPAANGAGWNNSDVTITWSATDNSGGSGIASINPATDSVTTNTPLAGVTKTATATDKVGNTSAAGSVTVKLDKTAPTISGSRTPAANGNGWNNTNVTVSFSCADGLSGIKGCTPASSTLSGEGANQSVTGTATDNADNTASATVSGISIDKTAPTLSGAPTTAPNGNGWYNGDVAVAWTAADALSGLASAAPANSTIGGEGLGLTASASVTDKAGNTASASSSPAVNIDRTAPNTTANAPSAWNNSNVTVALTASDALSGVATTSWRLDGGPTQTGTSVAITTEGTHSLEWWSTDKAGNTEAHKTATVKIDKTPPTISHTQSPAANGNGWNRTDVTVTFTCGDALSGIASCTTPKTVGTEGKNQPVVGTATDNAGNTATDPATVSIDKTPPTITLTPDRAPNANGWYNADVTVTAVCLDQANLSGIDGCPLAVTLGEGANQTVSGTATDAAGNATPASLGGINIDKTAPTVTGAPTTPANAYGWYSGDVTVAWTCADALSGLAAACPATATVTGEGTDLGASQSATDLAGNTGTGGVDGIRIDRTAPTTTAGGVPAGGAWQPNPVTVTFSASDNLSGLDRTFASVDGAPAAPVTSLTLGDGDHTVTFWSVDKAGNAEAQRTEVVRVDTQLPTIAGGQSPAANAAGWNNTPVTVTFACADQPGLSGLAACVPGTTVLGAEGKGQTVTGTATDGAGNTQTASATVDIDLTAPTATAAPDRPANAAGWYRDPVTVTAECSDALSGVAACPLAQTFGEGAGQSYAGTAADVAGNTTPVGVTGINVDQSAPSLSAAPTTAPNGNGWYNAPVTFQWTCSDQAGLSGIDGACPADSVIASEGVDQQVGADVADVAGNTAHGVSGPVSIDRTAPDTQADAPTGWANGDVHVTLTAADNLSGVDSTRYTVNGGGEQVGTTISFTAEGTYDVAFWSVDKAGNTEAAHTATIRIDRTRPHIASAQDPAANTNGWNNTAVTVTFTCTDELAGIASCTGASTLTVEGDDQAVTGTATDNAGNTEQTTRTVRIDLTPPTITAARTPAANPAGWNNQPVTVTFDCADGLSKITACPADVTFDDGTDQTATGTAVDAAGNTATASLGQIDVDTVAPALSGAPTTAANGAGWYAGDVGVAWTCGDDRSGVAACPADSVITGEGLALTASATVADNAGNQTQATSPVVSIDRHAPTTEIDAPGVWRNGPVAVALTAHDGLSGVDSTWYTVDGGNPVQGETFTVSGDGVHTITYWSVDRAGNTEAAHSATVQIDTVAPTIGHTVSPAPNAGGWNRTVPVTVTFACADQDALSGVAGCGPNPQTFSADGADLTATATATDVAGNTATDTVTVKIDTVDPLVSAAADRDPDANGWYNQDVTVSFSCADALSGIASCPAAKVLGEGAGQSATGTAADAAGNTATGLLAGIDVDKTKPTLSGAPTAPADGTNGWYRSPVTIHWTAADALSGIDPGTVPADVVLDQDGAGQQITATVSDQAGNDATATSPAVKIDRTPPTTTVDAPGAWVNQAVTVTLDAADGRSGVAATHYRLDGGPDTIGTSVPVAGDGTHTLVVWSVDNAGNVEAETPYLVRIDTTGPTISGAITPAPNAANWNNTDATVTFTCGDAGGSALASCTAPVVVTTEGALQPVVGTAADHAGNTTSATVAVSVDKTVPTITTGIIGPDRTASGWYNAPLTVTFGCADQVALSGLKSCTANAQVGQGANQSVTGTATDNAGNWASASVTGLNVDLTAPTIGGSATTAANGAGWHRGDVRIHWSCGDALSGVADCPADTVVDGEGGGLSATGTATDQAGNTASATVSGLRIDRTAPTTSATAPGGWRRGTVTVTLIADDNLSGVAATRYTVDNGPEKAGTTITVAGTGSHSVSYWSVDAAGNTEPARTVVILIDDVKPTITAALAPAPNANGWLNVPGTVTFSCADSGGSALAAPCPQPVTVTDTGATGQAVGATVADNAGNTASASVTVKVDRQAPSVTVGGVVQGARYKLGAVPRATCAAADSVSGLDGTCTVALSGGTRLGVGAVTATATARDKAGNVATVSVTYQVTYAFGKVFCLQPVNDTAHDKGSGTSIFKGGSTVPVKFQLYDANGRLVQAENAPVWLTPVSTGANGAAVNEASPSAAGDSGGTFRYDGQQYHYNWNTGRQQSGQYWQVAVRLDDGTTQYVKIGLS